MSAPRRSFRDPRWLLGPALRPVAFLLWFEVASRVVRLVVFLAALVGVGAWWFRAL